MKSKINIMIFYSDGRARNIPLDVFKTSKVILVVVAAILISGIGITAFNYYRLSDVKGTYTQTLHDLSLKEAAIRRQIEKLVDFEEKISFFLSGAVEDYGNPDAAAMGEPENIELGSLEDNLAVEDQIISRKQLSEPETINFSLNLYETEIAESPVAQLKNRLEELAVLAVKKKTRLDYTPSVRPAQGYISSGFGWRRSPFTGKRHYHRGIDIVNKIGTPIKATASGRVIFVGQENFWGNSIFIRHINGMITKFGHLSSFEVSRGDSVHRGDVIGYLGMSGRSTGPHLHYQIEIAGHAVNPLQFILENYD